MFNNYAEVYSDDIYIDEVLNGEEIAAIISPYKRDVLALNMKIKELNKDIKTIKFSKVENKLFPEFSDTIRKIDHGLIIDNIIKNDPNYIKANNNKEKYPFNVIRRDINNISSSLKMLLEMKTDIHEFFQNPSILQKNFMNIYETIEMDEGGYAKYIEKSLLYNNDRESFFKVLADILQCSKKDLQYKVILIVGADIITPIQHQIIYWMNKYKINTKFVVKGKYEEPKGERLRVNEILYITYNDRLKFIKPKEVSNNLGDYLSDYLDNKESNKDYKWKNKIEFKCTGNIKEYISYLNDSSVDVISSLNHKMDKEIMERVNNTNTANNILLKSQGIGPFIISLFDMFNKDGDISDACTLLRLNNSILYKVFQSNVLKDSKGENSSKYINSVKDLYTLFKELDDHYAYEWEKKLSGIIENYEMLNKISCDTLKIPIGDLIEIKNIIRVIIEIAEYIFILKGNDEYSGIDNKLIDYVNNLNLLIKNELPINKINNAFTTEELNDFCAIIEKRMSTYYDSDAIHNLNIDKTFIVSQLNSYLEQITNDFSQDKQNIDKIEPFNSGDDIGRIDKNIWITNFTDDNFSNSHSSYTNPISKFLMENYYKKIKEASVDEYNIHLLMIESSLNIFNTKIEQNIHSLYIYLGNEKNNITLCRFCEEGKDNECIIEKELKKLINGIENNEILKIDCDKYNYNQDKTSIFDTIKRENFNNKDLENKVKSLKQSEECYVKALLNSLTKSDCVRDPKKFEKYAYNYILNAYSSDEDREKLLESHKQKKIMNLENIINILFEGKHKEFKANLLRPLIKAMKHKEGKSKDKQGKKLKIDNANFYGTDDKELCSYCNYECFNKYLG